ncbi:unnamed protein product, partial [Heterosigma akashiwo]
MHAPSCFGCRFIGETKFAQGVWIGVELTVKKGKHDGTVKGVRYFLCPQNQGVFVRPDSVRQRVPRTASTQ